ncbi:hypothetical protein BKA69DRAFT_1068292 [Paraphysoderma sedebokerense]|nr:hypothetical protein BKA69DRAFT_1068292 [Paraphysoderma sedebokerense]
MGGGCCDCLDPECWKREMDCLYHGLYHLNFITRSVQIQIERSNKSWNSFCRNHNASYIM